MSIYCLPRLYLAPSHWSDPIHLISCCMLHMGLTPSESCSCIAGVTGHPQGVISTVTVVASRKVESVNVS